MADNKSDLIHVRSNQDFWPFTTALFVPDDIAHGVYVDGINQRRHRILDYTADNFFTARYAGSFTYRFKEVKVHVVFLSQEQLRKKGVSRGNALSVRRSDYEASLIVRIQILRNRVALL